MVDHMDVNPWIPICILIIFIILFGIGLLVTSYHQDEVDRNDSIETHFDVGEKYSIIVDSDWISGSDCVFAVSVDIVNSGQIIDTWYYYYDYCEDEL